MNWKKVVSVLLVSAMTLSMAACGDTASTSDNAAAGTETKGSTANASSDEKLVVWTLSNDLIDFGKRFQEQTGVEVDTVVIEPADYPTKVQTALLAGEKEPDIIVGEPKMLEDFFDAGFFEDLNQAPYNAQDYADQIVDYVWQVGQDDDGIQRAISYQITPAGIYYRRDIAKEVFGTDDPAEVQKKVADWDTFKATAAELKEKGYQMTSTVNDSYRVFSNNVSTPWVVDGKITVDNNIKNWVDMSKEMVDAGETATYELWSDDWSKGFFKDSNVFSYFGPAWFIDFSMSADQDGSVGKDGGWAATEGPQGFYWGGTWITAAAGTDNPTLVADIMRTMTTNVDVMKEIVTADNDFVNNKPAMEEMAKDESYGDAVLGGQNPLAMFCAGADKIDLSNMSIYDQGCNEEFQNAMKNYFEGNASYDEALDLFYKAVVEKYPELSY